MLHRGLRSNLACAQPGTQIRHAAEIGRGSCRKVWFEGALRLRMLPRVSSDWGINLRTNGQR